MIIQPSCASTPGATSLVDGFRALQGMIDTQRRLWTDGRDVHALVGPACMDGINLCAPLAAVANIPVVNYFSISYEADNQDAFRTMSRVGLFNTQMGASSASCDAIISFKHSHWANCSRRTTGRDSPCSATSSS